jgi:hypothetical protein
MYLRVRSLRLAVEPDYLHLTGIRVDRRYHLAPGSLARVASSAVTRRRRPGGLGRFVGPATLGTGETIELIRLGATPSVILVPTERGRVAIAPAAEEELVQALMAAARTRAERAPVAATVVSAPVAAAAAAPAVAAVVAAAAPVAPPEPPRPMTGIERMALEEKMAEERRAAMTGARSEQAAASFASAAALSPPARPAMPLPAPAAPMLSAPLAPSIAAPITPPVAPPVAPPPPAPVLPAAAAAAAVAPVAATPAVAAAVSAPEAIATPTPSRFPRALPRRRPQRPTAAPLGRPILTVDVGLLVAPLAAAGIVWLLAAVSGAAPGGEGLDPLGAALLLCGPIGMLAVFLARSRWPRLAGLTSVSALIALALVARSLIG